MRGIVTEGRDEPLSHNPSRSLQNCIFTIDAGSRSTLHGSVPNVSVTCTSFQSAYMVVRID